jgi:carbamoylphosphate synthase large subunit
MKLIVTSKHPSHRCLRTLVQTPFRCVLNMGRTDPRFLPRSRFVLLNPPDAVRNAADKKLMKECFDAHQIPTARWWADQRVPAEEFPVVVKHRLGSRGTGVYLMKTPDDLASFIRTRGGDTLRDNFVIEKFHNYKYEFRLHATRDEVFFANRKARKAGVPLADRWKHSNETSVWFNEANPDFQKPSSWDNLTSMACKATEALGIDFGAVDVKVNGRGKFFIIEVNSAPCLGGVTRDVYVTQIPTLAERVKEYRGAVDMRREVA